jgi:hypothetical protein
MPIKLTKVKETGKTGTYMYHDFGATLDKREIGLFNIKGREVPDDGC